MAVKSALVVDCRNRELKIFMASVTRAQSDNKSQLVLRYALGVGQIGELFSPKFDNTFAVRNTEPVKVRVEMPVILLGQYSAQSSEGHVTVHHNKYTGYNEAEDGYCRVVVVGGLGEPFSRKGLRVIHPISAMLVKGPAELEVLPSSGNSNPASADAAWDGVKLLASANKKSVFLVEGQSDYTFVVRLCHVAEELELAETEFPIEHRLKMFSRENIVRRILFGAAFHSLAGNRDDSDEKPSDDEVRAEVTRRLKEYFGGNRNKIVGVALDRRFEHLNMVDSVVKALAVEFGALEPIVVKS